MAPIPGLDLSVSSLELDRRTAQSSSLKYFKRFLEPISPLSANRVLAARDNAPNQYTPGAGAVDPFSINNKGVLALFGILSASLVLASIWFFFWAKNGGFKFRKGDWEDYKSTVLRRKGPDGKTLSNATKRTRHKGPPSSFGETIRDYESTIAEKIPRKVKKLRNQQRNGKKQKANHVDQDVRAYRAEKPAKVGGLNRAADGSYHDSTYATDPSVAEAPPAPRHHHETATPKPTTAREKKGRQFSYNPGTEPTRSVYSDDSARPLRASPAHHTHNRSSAQSTPTHTPRHSRQPLPVKNHHASPTHKPTRHSGVGSTSRSSMPGSYTDPIDFQSRYTESIPGTEESRGTKTYFHPIPSLSGKGPNGFRRGGGGRRDSLSDSDGETRRS